MERATDFPQRALQSAVELFNRNPWTSRQLQLVGRVDESVAVVDVFEEDGLRTKNAHPFTDDPRFVNAYQRAIRAADSDYGIRWRTHSILWAAETAARVDGAFVECGTGNGFMASAICEYLGWSDRPFFLFDTFEPREPPWTPFYAHGPESVAENFSQWPGVQLVVGRIPATLGDVEIDQVAFLHVDMNAAEPEEAAVRYFWPRLATGGVIVFDDYGFTGYEASRDAADRLAAELGFTVLSSPTGQGITIKQSPRDR